MNLTIFDLDNTLIAGDSDYAWGNFLIDKGIVNADIYARKNDRFYKEYKKKTLNILEYQEFVLTPLKHFDLKELGRFHEEFMVNYIEPLRLFKAEKLIAAHKKKGDVLLVITATNRFIAEPIVKALNINNLLATEPEIINDRFTGNIVGDSCFQSGKIKCLESWMGQQKEKQQIFNIVTFYSDSINDEPLLNYVDQAIAVDPDDSLRYLAKVKKWPVITLRGNQL